MKNKAFTLIERGTQINAGGVLSDESSDPANFSFQAGSLTTRTLGNWCNLMRGDKVAGGELLTSLWFAVGACVEAFVSDRRTRRQSGRRGKEASCRITNRVGVVKVTQQVLLAELGYEWRPVVRSGRA